MAVAIQAIIMSAVDSRGMAVIYGRSKKICATHGGLLILSGISFQLVIAIKN